MIRIIVYLPGDGSVSEFLDPEDDVSIESRIRSAMERYPDWVRIVYEKTR